MSIELLTSEHMSSFKNAVKNAKQHIKIISPFIGLNTSKIISQFMKENPKCKCTIITRFYTQDFLEGVSSLEGLKILKESNITLYALKKLHSKLYLIDDDYGIIGSANFTMGGFKGNHELSLVIEDEEDLLNNLNDYFNQLKQHINDSGEWEITTDKIEDEINMTERIFKNRKDKTVKCTNSKTWGANIKTGNKEISEEEVDNIEDFLKEDLLFSDEIAWLKFEGTGEDRVGNKHKYMVNTLESRSIYTTHFPRNPRSIESGTAIFLSVISYDEKGNATPIIVGRAKSHGYSNKNIVGDYDKKENIWLERYPYYIELYDIEIIDTEIVNGISLNSLIMQLGTDLYPNTVGKNLKKEEIRKRHHQKSHIKITPMAKKLLDDKLDYLLSKYGKRSVI